MKQQIRTTTEQRQVQQQRLWAQQVLTVKLTAMPLAELEQRVQAEIDDNPALEAAYGEGEGSVEATGGSDSDYTAREEAAVGATGDEDRQASIDEALNRMGADDEMPTMAQPGGFYGGGESAEEEHTPVSGRSIADSLREQVAETELTEEQKKIMEYLIGSLDADGMLRKTASDIVDELAVYGNTMVSEEDVRATTAILKSFDPAGIGAESLQECLLLQIERKPESALKATMRVIISKYYKELTLRADERIASQIGVDIGTVRRAEEEIKKLNPRPGSALWESGGGEAQKIIPDFVVERDANGTVTFYINKGRVPELHVSGSFIELLRGYKANSGSMNRRDKEALLYAKQRVDRARGYIEAVRQRQATMYRTMKAIIDIQKEYFESGDESDLRPMGLKDIAALTGLDISTVSRVCAAKYAQTQWGIFRLRHFFSEGISGEDGETIATRRLKVELKDIIGHEDKGKPLSDEALRAEMKKRGYDIARRTITKYREQAGIPVARLRKR